MATFPSIDPVYGFQKRSKPVQRTVRFADGYEHRILFGLDAHTNPKVYSLKFDVTETDSDTIETFLDARAADGATFDWTPLGSSTSYKWRCFNWSKSIPYLNRATIQATFVQYFEP